MHESLPPPPPPTKKKKKLGGGGGGRRRLVQLKENKQINKNWTTFCAFFPLISSRIRNVESGAASEQRAHVPRRTLSLEFAAVSISFRGVLANAFCTVADRITAIPSLTNYSHPDPPLMTQLYRYILHPVLPSGLVLMATRQYILYTSKTRPLSARALELCESRGGCPGFPVLNSPYGLCGRKAKLN